VRIIKKPVKGSPKKRLRAAAQRGVAKYDDEDYGADEPNVKLSRAFVVVLLLHVVAVGGIFTFSALKDRQTAAVPGYGEASGRKPSTALTNGTSDKGTVKPVPSDVQGLVDSSKVSGSSAGKSQNGAEPARVYVVQRGDSPAGIAKKFKVSYVSLLKTNKLDDPKKLQIGQKLLIP
jgi:LysM repeat protein